MEEKPTGCVVMWVCWKLGWRGGLEVALGVIILALLVVCCACCCGCDVSSYSSS